MRKTARGVVVDYAESTDPGRNPSKQVNEDCCAGVETPLGVLAVLCDGMGGHDSGREAAEAAVTTVLERLATPTEDSVADQLRHAVEAAGRAVWMLGTAGSTSRPGSTCVLVLLSELGAMHAHIGDSRLFLARAGIVRQLTRDHSVVQELVDSGRLAAHEAPLHPDANKITRALGIQPVVDVDVSAQPVPLAPDDIFVLASDGLTDLVAPEDIARLLTERLRFGTDSVAQALVALANERGGHDNITVQLLHVVDPASRPVGGTRLIATREQRSELSDTLRDGPSQVPRTTIPAPAPVRPTLPSLEEGATRPGPGSALTLLLLGVGVTAVLLVAVLIWALFAR